MSSFSFKTIDVPAAAGTYTYIGVSGLDASGDAVGYYGNVDGDGDGTFHGFIALVNGNGITLDPPGSTNTSVGITASGVIFGDYTYLNHQYGFVDNGGVFTTFDNGIAEAAAPTVPLAVSTDVDGITSAGVIYGDYADYVINNGNQPGWQGFLNNNGVVTPIAFPGANITTLAGINTAGTIVGNYEIGGNTNAGWIGHGFVDSNGSFTAIDVPGAYATSVVGISDGGEIVGNYQDSSNNTWGFVDNNGVITKINIAGATSTGVSAVNAAGEIVGYYADSGGNIHGFVDNGGVIATVDVPGATETDILGVNAVGVISGYYDDSSYNQHGFVGTPAPTTVIESFGSTSLVETGNNYFMYANGTTNGPELKYAGAAFVAGQFGSWTPIGAEQTATGYEVAWKLAGADEYTVWNTDSSGNYLSQNISGVSGTSQALESAETSFHQDLNGDGVIGQVVEAGGTLELAGADTGSVKFNGSTGTLILDHSSLFSGQLLNFTGDGNLSSSDQLDLRDIGFGPGTTVGYVGTSSGGTLTVSDAQSHTAHIALAGDYTGSTFTLSSDGSGGTTVIDPLVKQDTAGGTLSFSDPDPTDTHSVSVSPQDGATGYLGSFVADTVNAANGQDTVGWHFNFGPGPVTQTVTQSYNVGVADHHADGTTSAATQSVSVTIAGPGNDSFVFHPGIGAEAIVNAGTSDTFELDGFSSVTSNNQLATLLNDAQTGQAQSMFQAVNGGHDTLINLVNHDSITLTDVHIADLHASDFIIH